ncbi:aminoglycoside 3-N-acetyltransferase [Fibrella aquatilis]|uniref:Aminoglycoside N(3)-acetyltransferase n=1 Tax=Fibrella aquatilis TaxID=2817059 RepID=A0A939GAW9_9BACT|nr:aminoglycoside 3-N-acetyltransferase [Fibrella aquatilis]MBO0933884.1 aminoglycoside 3-N-acetyltransferase [Fibrella aquatilis]
MLTVGNGAYWTRQLLSEQLAVLGLRAGDAVMTHAGLRAVGPMLNGPDALIGAILDVVGPAGTLLVYVSWDEQYEDALEAGGYVPAALKPHLPPFDPARSRANRDHGVFAEFARTTPGAFRSTNPGTSVVALGHRAEWFTANHALQYGFGPDSPFAKLVAAGGQVLMIGAPLDTMSLLHHAEHLADIPGKRIMRVEVPLWLNGGVSWQLIEEFDTTDPVVDGLPADYFAHIVTDFLAQGGGQRGQIGHADAVLVPAADVIAYAVEWLEERFTK